MKLKAIRKSANSTFQIEVVAETVVDDKVRTIEGTVELISNNCNTLEQDLLIECEQRSADITIDL